MAKLLNIITDPNKILRRQSRELKIDEINTDETRILCNDMTRTMLERDGLGLAAPQIGKNIRLVTINTKDGILTMFNPQIIRKSLFKEFGIEGCLSIPNTYGSVKRSKKITCCYINNKGRKQEQKAQGLLARVIQHEVDHLNGILFIDRAKNIEEIAEKETD